MKVHFTKVGTGIIAAAVLSVLALPQGALANHDEFVRKTDRVRHELVSVAVDGKAGSGNSAQRCTGLSRFDDLPTASDDGRFVAFTSVAGDLHPKDGNGAALQDVFVRDTKTNKTELISITHRGAAPTVPGAVPDACSEGFGAFAPSISGNGRYVAFLSNIALTTDPQAVSVVRPGIYLHDRRAATNRLIETTNDGRSFSFVQGLSISDSGRFVAFADNRLDPAAQTQCSATYSSGFFACSQIYVHDRRSDKTTLITKGPTPQGAAGISRFPRLSDDGRFVVFHSSANLAPNDRNTCPDEVSPSCWDVFRTHIASGRTELVSVDVNGEATPGARSYLGDRVAGTSTAQVISEDGRYVVFESGGELVPGSGNGGGLLYLRDMEADRTERVAISSTGTPTQQQVPSITDDGRYVSLGGLTCAGLLQMTYCGEDHWVAGGYVLNRRTGQVDMIHTDDGSVPWIVGDASRVIRTSGERLSARDDNDFNDVYVVPIRMMLGIDRLGGTGPASRPKPDDRICIVGDVCLPPLGSMRRADRLRDVANLDAAADLRAASVAYRPPLGDIYVTAEIERLPSLRLDLPGASVSSGAQFLYGVRFQANGRRYEARATALLDEVVFFDCTVWCRRMGDGEGSIGTTGHRVTFSIPLDEFGLEDGGTVSGVEAFTARGTVAEGALQVVDVVPLGG